MPSPIFPPENIETTFHAIIERYQLKSEKNGRYRGYCPVHGGASGTSFQLSCDHRGIGLKCWGGCTFNALVEALGYTARDMFVHDNSPEPSPKPKPKPPAPRVLSESDKTVTVFDYHDANGKVVYRVRRIDFADERPKKIWPQFQVDGKWIDGLDERFHRYPYNLPALLDAIKRDEIICFLEGEGKTQRLIDEDQNATCIAGGSSSWTKYRNHYLPYFEGARVVLLPDNDEPGQEFVETVRADLKAVCKDVVILPLRGLQKPGEDIIEWLDIYGHTVDELRTLTNEAFEQPAIRQRVISETALDLWYAEIGPREDIIQELIPEGTHILASKKGIGKTNLLFNLAVSVSTGGIALSEFSTKQGGVLYYVLDDPRRRMKYRLHDMLGDTIGTESSPNVGLGSLALKYDAPRGAKAFLEDVQTHLNQHPDTKLIIVDTLGRIKPLVRGNTDLYQQENDFMTEIRKFMEARRLTCIFAHHTRKAAADDIYETISGSTGLLGATDGLFILESQRGSNTAILHSMGNDVGEGEIGLKFDPSTKSWHAADVEDVKKPIKGPSDVAQSPCRDWLKELLRTGALRPDDIIKQAKTKGFSRPTVYRAMKKADIRIFEQKEGSRSVTYWTLSINDAFPSGQIPEIPETAEIPEIPEIPETVPYSTRDTSLCHPQETPDTVEADDKSLAVSGVSGTVPLSQVSHEGETVITDDKSIAVSGVSGVSGIRQPKTSATNGTGSNPIAGTHLDRATLGCMHSTTAWDDDVGVSVCVDCGEEAEGYDDLSLVIAEPSYVTPVRQACPMCGVESGDCSHMRKLRK